MSQHASLTEPRASSGTEQLDQQWFNVCLAEYERSLLEGLSTAGTQINPLDRAMFQHRVLTVTRFLDTHGHDFATLSADPSRFAQEFQERANAFITVRGGPTADQLLNRVILTRELFPCMVQLNGVRQAALSAPTIGILPQGTNHHAALPPVQTTPGATNGEARLPDAVLPSTNKEGCSNDGAPSVTIHNHGTMLVETNSALVINHSLQPPIVMFNPPVGYMPFDTNGELQEATSFSIGLTPSREVDCSPLNVPPDPLAGDTPVPAKKDEAESAAAQPEEAVGGLTTGIIKERLIKAIKDCGVPQYVIGTRMQMYLNSDSAIAGLHYLVRTNDPSVATVARLACALGYDQPMDLIGGKQVTPNAEPKPLISFDDFTAQFASAGIVSAATAGALGKKLNWLQGRLGNPKGLGCIFLAKIAAAAGKKLDDVVPTKAGVKDPANSTPGPDSPPKAPPKREGMEPPKREAAEKERDARRGPIRAFGENDHDLPAPRVYARPIDRIMNGQLWNNPSERRFPIPQLIALDVLNGRDRMITEFLQTGQVDFTALTRYRFIDGQHSADQREFFIQKPGGGTLGRIFINGVGPMRAVNEYLKGVAGTFEGHDPAEVGGLPLFLSADGGFLIDERNLPAGASDVHLGNAAEKARNSLITALCRNNVQFSRIRTMSIEELRAAEIRRADDVNHRVNYLRWRVPLHGVPNRFTERAFLTLDGMPLTADEQVSDH